MAKRHLGVQLYTVRDQIARDFVGVIGQAAKMGYEGVELAGFGNLQSAEEVADVLEQADLKVCGAHIGIEQLENDLAGTLQKYGATGCENIIVPWLPEERRKDIAGWKAFAKQLNKLGKTLRKEGFKLGYHNHSFEFALVQKGLTGMDILIDETDEDNVGFELDCFWVVHGGKCPACFIKRNAGRIMTLHLKDMSDPFERKFANVGEGLLDIPGIVKAGSKAKVPWFIVEQDSCYDQDPMDAIRNSYNNLQKMDLF